MNGGRIEQVADPEALYRTPRTLFAARFIGAGSFVAAAPVARGDGWIDVGLAGTTVRTIDAGVPPDAVRVQVLLRPEDLRVVPPAPDALAATVDTCAFFGSEYELTASSPIGQLRLRTPAAVGVGGRIGVAWPRQAGISYAEGVAEASRTRA
jgi:ABC-type Fe3+/spermidine/putrescine transport system ATPase subunit